MRRPPICSTRFFAGTLDEARIWNYARNGAQLRTARSGEINSSGGLLGRFGMNEGAGTAVGNSAGATNGTAVGGPSWVTGYPFTPDTVPPAAPLNLSASADDGSATLSWSANSESDIAGYNLYRSTSSPVSTAGAPLNGADLIQGTTFNDSGLTNGTTYYYALVAVDSSDNRSAASTEASAAPVQGDPVLVGAGDIADCARTQDEATADLLDAVLRRYSR